MAAFWMMRCLSWALTTCRPDSMLLRAATWYRSSIFLEQQVGPLVWQTCRSAPGKKSTETGHTCENEQSHRWYLIFQTEACSFTHPHKRFRSILCMLNTQGTPSTADSVALMSLWLLCRQCYLAGLQLKIKRVILIHIQTICCFPQRSIWSTETFPHTRGYTFHTED